MSGGLWYEIRMLIAVTAVHSAMFFAPKSHAGLRLIKAIGEHFEREIHRLARPREPGCVYPDPCNCMSCYKAFVEEAHDKGIPLD